jgi:hypothetical protein
MPIKRSLCILFVFLGISFFTYFSFFRFALSCVKIPVLFSLHPREPLIKANIQGDTYLLMLDFGASQSFYLDSNALGKLKKDLTSTTARLADFRGNIYNWPIYSVEKVNIGPFAIPRCDIVAESLDFHSNTNPWMISQTDAGANYQGRIGWKAFKDFCCLVDFPNASIYLAESIQELEANQVLETDHFIAVPITVGPAGLLLSIQTDFGCHQFVMDTGSTLSALNRSLIASTEESQGDAFAEVSMSIRGTDFGKWRFGIVKFSKELAVDGILGADFFLKHAVCFDFPNKIAWIQKSTF